MNDTTLWLEIREAFAEEGWIVTGCMNRFQFVHMEIGG
jgi:hypothetical protein